MYKHVSEDTRARVVGTKKRKKYVFLEKFEELKEHTQKINKKFFWWHVLETVLIVMLFLKK